jgi:hypothetical protein
MSLETGTYISDLVATNPLATDPKSQGDDHIRLLKATVKATFPNVAGAVTPTHTELNYVDGVTSSIQTQLDSKGAIAGQAWTGTHTFVTQMVGDNSTKVATTAYVDGAFGRITGQAWTGSHTFPTQSAGDNSTKVATTAYVDQTAFATALPAQGGEGGKFLTTDGTDASWVNAAGAALTYFGDGSDGDVTVSGSVTLSRDMYYNNLILSSDAALDCRGYRIFVANTLDLTAAPAGAIRANGGNGTSGGNGSATVASVGSGGAAGSASTVGVGAAGVGGTPPSNAGSNNGNGAAGLAGGNGGVGGASGAAGSGDVIVGTGLTGRTGGAVTATVLHRVVPSALLTTTDNGSTLIAGGGGGASGPTGSPDGTNFGGGGGGGGAGGGIVQIYARYVDRGASTAAGAIQAKGGNGGAGGSRTVGNCGGGAGGAGGGGGWVYLVCQTLLGSAATNAIDVTGGNGGAGGAGTSSAYNGGGGGGAGGGGRFTLAQMDSASYVDAASGVAAVSATTTSTSSGGAATTATAARFDL